MEFPCGAASFMRADIHWGKSDITFTQGQNKTPSWMMSIRQHAP